jgi:hypothetical protein
MLTFLLEFLRIHAHPLNPRLKNSGFLTQINSLAALQRETSGCSLLTLRV